MGSRSSVANVESAFPRCKHVCVCGRGGSKHVGGERRSHLDAMDAIAIEAAPLEAPLARRGPHRDPPHLQGGSFLSRFKWCGFLSRFRGRLAFWRFAATYRAAHQPLYNRYQWFRGGLVFKAHTLLYHSTLGLRDFYRTCIESKKEEEKIQGCTRRGASGAVARFERI